MILLRVSALDSSWWSLQPQAYDEPVRQQMAGIPGVKWDPKAKAYTVASDLAPYILRRLERAKLVKVKHLDQACERTARPQDELADRRRDTAAKLPASFAALRPYQLDGATFLHAQLCRRGAALLGDDAGVGKSAQVLAAWSLLDERPRRVLIVCPAVVVPHWCGQIARWAQARAVVLRAKMAGEWDEAQGFHVVSYDTLRSLGAKAPLEATASDMVVLDEIHYLANQRAQRSKVVAKLLRRGPLVVGMTGTPITSRVHTLWHPLHLLFPEAFGTFYNFTARYCGGHYDTQSVPGQSFWVYDGSSNEEELSDRLSRLMLRRSIDILDLPPRNRITMPVEVPQKMLDKLLAQAQDVADTSELRRVLAATEAPKLKAAAELGRNLIEQGHRVLFYTLRKKTAEELARLLDVAFVTGDHDVKTRQQVLTESCNASGGAVATIYSVTTGIDLVSFDTGVFVGLDHVPSTLLQAEGRLHRLGQRATVNFYYLIGLRTPDEVVRHRVIKRLDYYARIVGNFSSAADLGQTLGENKRDDLDDLVQVVRDYAGQAGVICGPGWDQVAD